MESPPPASSLPLQDMLWTARQACSPPRAATFFSAICAAVSLAAGGVLVSVAARTREPHRQTRTVKGNEHLCNMLRNSSLAFLGGSKALIYFYHESVKKGTGGRASLITTLRPIPERCPARAKSDRKSTRLNSSHANI